MCICWRPNVIYISFLNNRCYNISLSVCYFSFSVSHYNSSWNASPLGNNQEMEQNWTFFFFCSCSYKRNEYSDQGMEWNELNYVIEAQSRKRMMKNKGLNGRWAFNSCVLMKVASTECISSGTGTTTTDHSIPNTLYMFNAMRINIWTDVHISIPFVKQHFASTWTGKYSYQQNRRWKEREMEFVYPHPFLSVYMKLWICKCMFNTFFPLSPCQQIHVKEYKM